MQELDEMRQQLAALKGKLDKEQIINEKLLRASMKQKAGVIKRQRWISLIAAGFVVAMAFSYYYPMGFSLGFCIGTSIFMIFCCAMTNYYHRDVSDKAMDEDLLTVAQNVQRLKRRYQQWLKISIPLVLLWVIWLLYEVYKFVDGDMFIFWTISASALVGGIIGGIIGWRMHCKVLKTCDEIVEQIEAAE